MSLCTPRGSWFDDDGSEISEPDSADRITIVTAELSPTPSKMVRQLSPLLPPPPLCSAQVMPVKARCIYGLTAARGGDICLYSL
jgi:hypothetical protein